MLHNVIFEIDTDASCLGNFTNEWLASLWHIGQANPAPFGDRDAGLLVKAVGDEIVRRWLAAVPATRYNHQASDHDHKVLADSMRIDNQEDQQP